MTLEDGPPIVESPIELHGGTLEMAGEPGAGTTARLRFPASRSVG